MKAWWKIHDKPRGRWRPLMEWGVSLSPEEKEEGMQLNIVDRLFFAISYNTFEKMMEKCGRCALRSYTKIAAVCKFPQGVFKAEYNKPETGYALGCRNCDGYWVWAEYVTFPDYTWKCRLPWRPGARPDYSDFIEPVRDFLRQVMEEIERRFQEARESAPSDEWMLEEEFDAFSWRTLESGVEVAERKLRVIRK